jgi:hypothetical protein
LTATIKRQGFSGLRRFNFIVVPAKPTGRANARPMINAAASRDP